MNYKGRLYFAGFLFFKNLTFIQQKNYSMAYPFSLIEVFNEPKLNFKGNTAAVVLLEKPIDKSEMQQIAKDFMQPATTFLWPKDKLEYAVRWFAPDSEIDLCGHGSLAAIAYLAINKGISEAVALQFENGTITGEASSNNFASISIKAIPITRKESIPSLLEEALDVKILEHFSTANKNIVLLENEEVVKNMKPDFGKLRQMKTFGYAVTAKGNEVDFVSRTLVPHVQQLEDPATGSSHAALLPFWAERLKKNKLTAHQLSERGGKFNCELSNGQAHLGGNFTELAKGTWL